MQALSSCGDDIHMSYPLANSVLSAHDKHTTSI